MTKDILQQLRKARQEKGISQESLGLRLNNCSHGYLNMVENGKRGVKLYTLTRWADLLGYEVKLVRKGS